MTAQPWAEQQARVIVEEWHGGVAPLLVKDIATALQAAYQRGLEEAARVCEAGVQGLEFHERGGSLLSPWPQGLTESGKGQLIAWRSARNAIRQLGGGS